VIYEGLPFFLLPEFFAGARKLLRQCAVEFLKNGMPFWVEWDTGTAQDPVADKTPWMPFFEE
jgi:hypothetical protein